MDGSIINPPANRMDITKVSDIELMSMVKETTLQVQYVERNLQALHAEMERRITEFKKGKENG
jgi:hypothetical protein